MIEDNTRKQKIIDIFSFNGEADLLEIRLNILNDVVDQFIIVEARTTFSGKSKPLYYEKDKERYAKWHHKIKYHVVDESDAILWKMARESPNTQGAEHWKREFVQKEAIKDALTHLQDDDVVFIGDCDEIWDPKIFTKKMIPLIERIQKLSLRVYSYYLNNRSSELFWGTIVGQYKDIKNECLNHLRSNVKLKTRSMYIAYWGWHFTSLKDGLRRKLEDSYTSDSYATPQVMENLEENVKNNRDFLGRDFTYRIDEVDLPQYLLDNKEKWKRLFR